MKIFWQCMFAPRLYKVYNDGPKDVLYQPQGREKYADMVISTAHTLLRLSMYTTPFITMYLYKRGFLDMVELMALGRFFGALTCLVGFAFMIRANGRAYNPKYVRFVKALNTPTIDQQTYMTEIRKFDFDFKAWPTTYSVAKQRTSWFGDHPFKNCASPHLPVYLRVPLQIMAYLATHTFGLRLIYPGSLSVVHTMLWGALFQGRTVLVENHDAKRAKIETADGNHIDTIFVDNRSRSMRGRTLVICCEGNSGFYEIGIMCTPIKSCYSALGWNHPGFGGSTGKPYPSQEHNAIDAVMQYAINVLHFQPDKIVMFGWSIGGYTATWAAVNYPVASLILDATFDDLLYLAQNQMPDSWAVLVKEVVRSYVNLNISEMLVGYKGPVQLVRRTEDEIICLRQGILSTNRGNYLLMDLIDQRHKALVQNAYSKVALIKLLALADYQRNALSATEIQDFERPLLALINRYMQDYKSSHCTPLPESNFISIMDRLEAEKQE